MSQSAYRRRAILTRVHKALDAFYLLQNIDCDYDIHETLERILGLALEEVELEGDRLIERALVIVQTPDGEDLEVKAGWKTVGHDTSFSRTVVQQTLDRAESILCENAKDDPRFMEAESLKSLRTLSLVSVPLESDGRAIGAFYVESESAGNIFNSEDLVFLQDFARTISPYIKSGLTHRDHVREIRKLQEEVQGRYRLGNIIGRSESIQSVFELIEIASTVDRTVLISGESGSGKELVARAIHYNGRRRSNRFVVVDCSSLSEHLLESELFGHVKGAFTGASHDKYGAFEEADGGTIFLDEISDAPRPMQQRLRRVLQEGEIRRVGENEVRHVDVRVICATNQSLAEEVKEERFIHDLYHRINRFPIHIPPLRNRREDIPLLVHHFLELLDEKEGRSEPRRLSPEALEQLVRLDWRQNNIRELRNTVELAADLAQGADIDAEVLGRVFRIQGDGASRTAPESASANAFGPGSVDCVSVHRTRLQGLLEEAKTALDAGVKIAREETPFYRAQLEFEARTIIEALRFCGWKLRPAARHLGISPMKLRESIRRFLAIELERAEGSLQTLAEVLDIPLEFLDKKADDFGLAKPGQPSETLPSP